MSWQQYQRPSSQNPKLRNLKALKNKIRHLQNYTKAENKLYSSVSLPNFSRARLRWAIRTFFIKTGQIISESEFLISCLVLTLAKLKHKEGILRQKTGPRNRLYNEKRYSYEIVPVYLDRHLWSSLKARAFELEVSLSFLADLALRTYLSNVLEKLLWREGGFDKIRKKLRKNRMSINKCNLFGKEYTRYLLRKSSYQKKLVKVVYGFIERKVKAYFSLNVDYSIG